MAIKSPPTEDESIKAGTVVRQRPRPRHAQFNREYIIARHIRSWDQATGTERTQAAMSALLAVIALYETWLKAEQIRYIDVDTLKCYSPAAAACTYCEPDVVRFSRAAFAPDANSMAARTAWLVRLVLHEAAHVGQCETTPEMKREIREFLAYCRMVSPGVKDDRYAGRLDYPELSIRDLVSAGQLLLEFWKQMPERDRQKYSLHFEAARFQIKSRFLRERPMMPMEPKDADILSAEWFDYLEKHEAWRTRWFAEGWADLRGLVGDMRDASVP